MSSSDKMLAVLSLFSVEHSEWTVEQAAQMLNASISTTYRYFASLSVAGLIAPVRGGRYALGPAAIQFDWQIRQTDPLLLIAKPAMQILTGAIDCPAVILLCRLYHGKVMCVAQQTAGNPAFASSYQRGRPMPLIRGAASKIILANMPNRVVKAMHARHAEEMAAVGLGHDWGSVRNALRQIREEGCCVTKGEIDKGLFGIASPILSAATTPLGCLGLVLANDPDAAEVARLARLVRSAATQITTAYGG